MWDLPGFSEDHRKWLFNRMLQHAVSVNLLIYNLIYYLVHFDFTDVGHTDCCTAGV